MNAENLEDALTALEVQQMQDICRDEKIDHRGNRNILRVRLRRHVEDKKKFQEFLKNKFPHLPPDLAQKSFEINSLLAQYAIPNARSTTHFDEPPSREDQNLPVADNTVELATNLPALNTTFRSNQTIPMTSAESSNPINPIVYSPILAGDLGDFGQTVTTSVPETRANQTLPNYPNSSQIFPGLSQGNMTWSNTMGPGLMTTAVTTQGTLPAHAHTLNASAHNFTPQNLSFQAVPNVQSNFAFTGQQTGGQVQNNTAAQQQLNLPVLAPQGQGGNLAANFSQNYGSQSQTGQNFAPYMNMYELFGQFCQFMFTNTQNQQIGTYVPQPALEARHYATTHFAPQPNPQPTMVPQHNLQNYAAPVLDSSVPERVQQQPLIPQTRRYGVEVKRISHISQALGHKKNFFSGRAGSDPHKFMASLEESARFMGLIEDEVFCCLPVVLQFEALEWFRLEEPKFENFQDFKTKFLEHYRVPYFQDRLAEEARLRTQGKDEPIQSYVTCLRLIFEKLNPKLPLDRQLDRAVQNLNPKFALQINRKEVNSFEDLLVLGKQVEVKLHNISHYNEPPPPSQALLTNAAYYPIDQEKEVKTPKEVRKPKEPPKKPHPQNPRNELAAVTDSKPKKGRSNQSGINEQRHKKERVFVNSNTNPDLEPTKEATQPESEEMPKPGECFKCRRTGHKMSECTLRPKFKYYCYGCGRANKIKPNCSTPGCKRRKQENQERGQSE